MSQNSDIVIPETEPVDPELEEMLENDSIGG